MHAEFKTMMMQVLLGVACLLSCTTAVTGICVSDCAGVTTGNYQSCDICNGYVTCDNGVKYDRLCPPTLVWDDSLKICNYESTTCPSPMPPTTTITPGTGTCVSDCAGVTTGNYQSCDTCNGYVTCDNGVKHDRLCPPTLVWDDSLKICNYESTTCPSPMPPTTTITPGTGTCVSDCAGVTTGNYQSCDICNGYVTCDNGVKHDRLCPPTLVWDDSLKLCNYESTTCPSPMPPTTTITPGTGTCVSDCAGIATGNYQSCDTCFGFVTCDNGVKYDMPCAATTVWDDTLKICSYSSPTCP